MIRAWATHRGHSELACLFVYGFLAGVRRADFAIYFFRDSGVEGDHGHVQLSLGYSTRCWLIRHNPHVRISFHERNVLNIALNACGIPPQAALAPRASPPLLGPDAKPPVSWASVCPPRAHGKRGNSSFCARRWASRVFLMSSSGKSAYWSSSTRRWASHSLFESRSSSPAYSPSSVRFRALATLPRPSLALRRV